MALAHSSTPPNEESGEARRWFRHVARRIVSTPDPPHTPHRWAPSPIFRYLHSTTSPIFHTDPTLILPLPPSHLSLLYQLTTFSAGVAAIIKSTYLPALSKKVDYTYAGSDVLIWGGSETGLTIVASSIGTYRPLFKKIISYATTSQDKSNYYILDKIKGKSGQSEGGTAHVHTRGTSKGLGGRKTPDPNVPYWSDTFVGDGTEKRGSDSHVDVEGGFPGDGNSDRAILGENTERIKKTTDVIISYKERQRP